LSDISHLYRIDYKSFEELDRQLFHHVKQMSPVRKYYGLVEEIKRQYPSMAHVYVPETLGLLIAIRDEGTMSRREFKSRLEDRGIDANKLGGLLTRFKLAIPTYGRNGAWKLID
jgi:hypothetical protein